MRQLREQRCQKKNAAIASTKATKALNTRDLVEKKRKAALTARDLVPTGVCLKSGLDHEDARLRGRLQLDALVAPAIEEEEVERV